MVVADDGLHVVDELVVHLRALIGRRGKAVVEELDVPSLQGVSRAVVSLTAPVLRHPDVLLVDFLGSPDDVFVGFRACPLARVDVELEDPGSLHEEVPRVDDPHAPDRGQRHVHEAPGFRERPAPFGGRGPAPPGVALRLGHLVLQGLEALAHAAPVDLAHVAFRVEPRIGMGVLDQLEGLGVLAGNDRQDPMVLQLCRPGVLVPEEVWILWGAMAT